MFELDLAARELLKRGILCAPIRDFKTCCGALGFRHKTADDSSHSCRFAAIRRTVIAERSQQSNRRMYRELLRATIGRDAITTSAMELGRNRMTTVAMPENGG